MQDQKPPVKFSNEFTAEIEKYIEIYKKQGKKPSVSGFANRIGTDEKSIWAWATKQKKDEKGNVTNELARPNFHAAVTRLREIETTPEEDKLNERQELFCKLYAKSREHFGNATSSYITAYGIDQGNKVAYDGARASASTLLTNLNILQRVNELLGDLTEEEVDQELAFVIRQNYELPSKVAAIREYNKLKQRIVERMDHTSKGEKIQPILGGISNNALHSDNSNA